MNISIYKTLKVLIYLVFLVLPLWSSAQTVEYHSVVKNDTLDLHYVNCNVTPLQVEVPPNSGIFLINGLPVSPVWGNNLVLSYIPNTDFTGQDTLTVISSNQSGTGGAGPVTKILVISVVDFMVNAEDDFVNMDANTTINIDVLTNDNASNTINVDAIPTAEYGLTTILPDNTIDFIPHPGFAGVAQFYYTACIAAGQCDEALVTVFVQPSGTVLHDTVYLATRKNMAKDLLIPQMNGYGVLDAPVNGTLTSVNEGLIRYTPYNYFTGIETFRCEYNTNANTFTRVFVIDVLNTSNPNTIGKDDYAFTSIDGVATISPIANDEGFNLNLGGIAQAPSHGTYTVDLAAKEIEYQPDLGYYGVDEIVYTVCTPTYQCEQATIYIFVGNMKPSPTSYDLTTIVNTPKVINYGIPITDWDFVLNNPTSSNGGSIVYEPDYYTGTINGQTVSGYNLLIYTPPTDYTGPDDFSFQYCVDTDCNTVDITLDVNPIPNNNVNNFCVDDCVWPGDANNDGLADMNDLLALGYCIGETGTARPNGEVQFYGQHGTDWGNAISQSGVDLKYVDTDGNGTIEADDTLALSTFYGQYHSLTPEPNTPINQAPLFFVTRTPNPGPGDYVRVDVYLGIESIPAVDFTGVSFTLNYNTETIVPGSFHVIADPDSWMAYNSPTLALTKEETLGQVDFGFTRTDGFAESGYGRVAIVDFIIDDIIDGVRLKDSLQTRIRVNQPTAMGKGGAYNQLKAQDHWMTVYLDQDRKEDLSDDDLVAYPNPTQDVVNLHLNGRNAFRKVSLFSILGQPIEIFEVDGKQTSIDMSGLKNGMYVLSVVTDKGYISKKIEVMRDDN